MARKPQIGSASTGDAFAGVIPDISADESQTAPASREPRQPKRLPSPGDDAYERLVQTNNALKAGLRAKLRALRDADGVKQNEVVGKALEEYFERLEARRGPLGVQMRHYD